MVVICIQHKYTKIHKNKNKAVDNKVKPRIFNFGKQTEEKVTYYSFIFYSIFLHTNLFYKFL